MDKQRRSRAEVDGARTDTRPGDRAKARPDRGSSTAKGLCGRRVLQFQDPRPPQAQKVTASNKSGADAGHAELIELFRTDPAVTSNVLTTEANEIGVGYAQEGRGSQPPYWVAVIGARG